MKRTSEYEVIVVGGGPAGLSAGLWLGRYLRRTLLIDSGEPRNWESIGVNGYLGLPKIRPSSLRRRGRAECRRHEVKLLDACVDRVKRDGIEHFVVTTDGGQAFTSRRLVLAIGLMDAWPDLPGLDRCYGQTAHHCPDCDGHSARDRKTIVIGHDRKAAALALALTTWTPHLIICTNGLACAIESSLMAKLDALDIPVLEEPVARTHSVKGELRWLELENGMQVDAEKLFFTVTHHPADDLGVQLGCERNEDGLIMVDHTKRTSVEHVFAVGDITPGAQLAITAAADGAVAAAAIHRSLLPESRRL